MSAEQNKAIVRRFVKEVVNGRETAPIDELVADNYVGHNLPPGTPPGVSP